MKEEVGMDDWVKQAEAVHPGDPSSYPVRNQKSTLAFLL